jgi:hypothetical protein
MDKVNRGYVTTYQNIDPNMYSNGVGVLGKKSSWQKDTIQLENEIQMI